MHSTQFLQALAVALTTFSVAYGAIAEPKNTVRLADAYQIVKRQGTSSGTSSSAAPTTSAAASTTPITTARTTTPTSAPPTTPTTTTAPPPTTPTTATVPSTTAAASTTPTTAQSTTAGTTSQSSSSASIVPTTITRVVTETGADGKETQKTTEEVTQATVLADTPSSSNQGMDEKTRNTIIGVVVGVGGAIVLGVVGLVAYRIWGRKKNQDDSDNTFGGPPVYSPVGEKPEPTANSMNSRTPFQSTLESYHAPTQVNTASNF